MPKPPRLRPPADDAFVRPEKTFAAEVVETTFDLWGAIYDGLREAMTDIAKKVFEEGWFGREISAREVDLTREPVSYDTRLSFHELMEIQARMLPTPDPAARAQEPDIHGPEM